MRYTECNESISDHEIQSFSMNKGNEKSAEVETRKSILDRWEKSELKSDEEVLKNMRRDGYLAVHQTIFGKEAIKNGFILPTVIYNEKYNLTQNQGQRHPSEALHFSVNCAYTPNWETAKDMQGEYAENYFFVVHPGVLMTKKDTNLSTHMETSPEINDVAFRGYKDGTYDETAEFSLREGFFMVPDGNIDPISGYRTDQMSKEEYDQNTYLSDYNGKYGDFRGKYLIKGTLREIDPPDKYKYAVSSRDFWNKKLEQLPIHMQARLFFYKTKTHQGALEEFRQHFQIPDPDPKKFFEEISKIGFDEEHHGDASAWHAWHEGKGRFSRLRSNFSIEFSTIPHESEKKEISDTFDKFFKDYVDEIDTYDMPEERIMWWKKTFERDLKESEDNLSQLNREGNTDLSKIHHLRHTVNIIKTKIEATNKALEYIRNKEQK